MSDIAVAFASLLQWDDAIEAAHHALRLRPDFPLARSNLAWAEGENQKASTRGSKIEVAVPHRGCSMIVKVDVIIGMLAIALDFQLILQAIALDVGHEPRRNR